MSALLPGFRIDKIWGKSGYMTEKYENRYFQIIYKFIDPRDTRSDIDSEDELAGTCSDGIILQGHYRLEKPVSKRKRTSLYGA